MFFAKSAKFIKIGIFFHLFTLLFSGMIVFTAPKIGGAEKAMAATAGVGVQIPGSDKTRFDYKEYIKAIYKFSIQLATPLVILLIVYAGYIYIFSQGDTSKLNNAKDIMVGAILGYLLLLTIGLILDFIGLPDLGIDAGTKQ